MNEQPHNDPAFEALIAESRVARTARMLDETSKLLDGQRKDIVERFQRFMEEFGYTQAAVGRELGWSSSAISEIVRLQYRGKTINQHLVKLHNWMELTARRENMLHKRKFVEHSVAVEILQVAEVVCVTCKMGAVFGPAQIGKTMTLEAIQGDPRYGDPVLIRIDESLHRPFALCRAIAAKFDLSTGEMFDAVMRRLVARLAGTKRMLMFDEVERVHHKTLEMIRDLHDQTGCPVLLCGKPKVFDKLGFRHVGNFSEVTDQLTARVAIYRDLTARTRAENPQPLYSLEDIRKLVQQADLKVHVSPDAEKWLQMRAGTLGTGGIGRALVCLYLAFRVAYGKGLETITARLLDEVAALTMGNEDAQRVAEVVAESSGMRRVV